jgi:hypothetical protein
MEWLTSNGEIYHRVCKQWFSVNDGKCEHCGNAIPVETLRTARDQMNERAKVARRREVQQRTAATARKLAEMQARTDATLRRVAPDEEEPGKNG